MQIEARQKKKNLGIFYTPEPVVDIIFTILNIWKKDEDDRLGKWAKKRHYPSIIDPACGEGIFLKKAIESGFTRPMYVWGIDIDPSAIDKWKEINLFQLFNSKAKPELHFFNQNGLLPLNGDLRFRHKKGGLKEFDAVVGNPPYGGLGIGHIDEKLENALLGFEIWKRAMNKNGDECQPALDLLGDKRKLKGSHKDRLKRFPIEVLFLDRFIQLAKDGGWIAIVVPDGILANSNLQYVRDYVINVAKVEAIISLPRNTFKDAGTSAKTSLLILRKIDTKDDDYPIFLASLETLAPFATSKLLELYEKFFKTGSLG